MRLRAALSVLALIGILTSCGAGHSAVGVVTAFDGDLQTVNSFTIQTLDGDEMTFVPDIRVTLIEFPVTHLKDHLVSGDRIRVVWEERDDGTLVAVAISDA